MHADSKIHACIKAYIPLQTLMGVLLVVWTAFFSLMLMHYGLPDTFEDLDRRKRTLCDGLFFFFPA